MIVYLLTAFSKPATGNSMSDISTLLFKAQTEFNKQKEQLEGAFAAELANLMVKAKAELSDALEKATDIFDNIPLQMRNDILTDKEIARKVSILTPNKGKKATQGKARVSEADILAYLKTFRAQS